MFASLVTFRPRTGRVTLTARIAAALALSRQRRSLATLDDARLDDIGLTRDAARREARRPVWDVPRGWRV